MFFDPSSRWYYPVRWLLLILIGLAIYAQTFRYDFVFDDNFYILNTPYIRSFDKIDQIWAILPWTRMVGVYSFLFNYQINGFNPQGYHIFNFVIHLIAAGLVWALARLLFKMVGWISFREGRVTESPSTLKSAREKGHKKSNRMQALAVKTTAELSFSSLYQELPYIIALLFLVHPCQTQAVSYISQRFESMATVFYLTSVYTYLRGRISPLARQRNMLFCFSVGFAILGILTKEVAVTIPLMILAVEYIFFNQNSSLIKSLPKKFYLPIIFLGAIFVLLFMKLVRTDFINIYFHFSGLSESHQGDLVTGGRYFLTQMRVFLTFLRLLIFPINQNLDYDYPLSTGIFNPPITGLGLCLICYIVFLIFKLRQGQPLIAFGLAWLLITFSVNTAPRVNVIFEHKIYLISFGFFLSIVCALSMVIKDRRVLYVILIALIAVLALVSYNRNRVWRSEFTLWEDVARKSPHKARAYNGLGTFYGKHGDFIRALSDFNKAIAIDPDFAEAYNNRGNTYSKEGNYTQALLNFNKALEINPSYAQAHTNRGIIFDKDGYLSQALVEYNKAIEIDVYDAEAYLNRGILYEEQKRGDQALSDYAMALEINPNLEEAYEKRGFLFVKEGKCLQAMSDFEGALQINPQRVEIYATRGICYSQEGDFKKALLDYSKAMAINPQYPEVYYNRAVTFFQLKEYDRAWEDLHRAGELGTIINPQFVEALRKSSGKNF